MKKFTSLILLFSILSSFIRIDTTNALLIGPNLDVKISSNADETYYTTLDNIGIGTSLSFKNTSIITDSSSSGTYTINFHAGFTYNSYDTSENTCGFTPISATNSSFKYSFTHSGSSCESIIIMNYTVNSNITNGQNNINILDSSNNIQGTVIVNAINHNSVTSAQTLDLNGNGYIDAYKLDLLNTSNTGTLSGLLINGVTVGSISSSGTSYILPFSDNILNTGETPQISGTFDTINIGNNDINETDLAKPIAIKINSTLLSTLGSQSLNIGTGTVNFEFSENLAPTSTQAFSLKKGADTISGTFSFLNNDLTKLYFTPSSALIAGTYSLIATSEAKDWSSNGNILDLVVPFLIVSDTTNPIGQSIGGNTGININDGASLTNNNYVQLTLAATDDIGVNQMMISNYSNFSGASWETYNTSKSNWNLSTGTGTVYVKFKDTAGNISATYSDSIVYGATNNYINFNNIDSIYTNSATISLSGTCNYISNTGAILSSILSGSVNGISIGAPITCINQTWTASFTLTDNTTNLIRLEYDINSTINNQISITRPVPTCTAPTNATLDGGTTYPTCNFTCNAGYTEQGGSCIANTQTATCGGTIPANAVATTASTYIQTWNGTSWTPTSTWTNGAASCGFSCSTGTWNGTSCYVAQSSGGGGSTPLPICKLTDLDCKLSGGTYKYFAKISCSGGDLGKACIPTTTTQTGITNTGTTNTGSTSTGTTSTGTVDTNIGTIEVPKIVEIVKYDGTKIIITDIYNNFAKNYIETLAASGIINGYSDNTFRPDNKTSRIEFLKMLIKGLGINYLSYVGKKNPYWDVNDNSWQSPVVARALELGIISKNRYFYPDKLISREESMKMLIKAAKINLITTSKSSFDDGNGWAINYIETAYELGIISGQTIGGKLMFRPTDNITRAEVAKIIVKIIGLVN